MAEESALKLKRRTAKAKLTRTEKAVQFLLNERRPNTEIQEVFKECHQAFQDVCEKHETFTSVVTDDEEFERQETWMEVCQQAFLNLKVQVNDYCYETVSREGEAVEERAIEDNDINPVPLNLDQEDDVGLVSRNRSEGEVVHDQEPTEEVYRRNFKMEKPKMPKFGGDVRDYHIFKSDFLHAVSGYSKRDAISLLRSCLYGKPSEMVRGIGSDYEAVWEYLDSFYGDPRFIADAIINDINKFKNLKDGEDSRFCELVHVIRRSYNTLKEVGCPHDMDNSQMLALIERKLNTDDRKVWFRFLEREKQPASLSILIDWLTKEMKSRIRATAPIRCDSSKSGISVYYAAKDNENTNVFYKCWICKTGNHWVDQCNTLMNMTQQQRLKIVKENHACFSCLKKAGRDHQMATCKRKRQCSEVRDGKQCSYFHHPLLHIRQDNMSGSVGIARNGSTETLLPVLQADIEGHKGRKQRGNVLLDSGAEMSLITTSVAENLRLKGRDITITITKVGGEQEQLQTKMYQLHLRSLATYRVYSVNAVGLPNISEELENIQMDQIVKQFGLKSSEINRGSGPVDLLVGIDYPKMHCGKVMYSGNLVARCCPLGWVIFGSAQGQPTKNSSVFYVKVSPPVDMTDFWTTECMGVRSSSCQCEPSRISKLEQDEGKIISDSCQKVGKQWLVPYPWRKDAKLLLDNRAQAERTLKATEKRLSKNPSYAKAYDKEIIEMTELNFARKLSDDEMLAYSGPVHYISHHAVLRPEKKSTPVRIVFNSSASFQGHCLNDYWLKGPDLLNNLFGVLVRFREHAVAACGDISKMYHRVLIPEVDQHVHRFLWRNMLPEKSPDVYMKTVLTFGDKPAPAMAQIALLKTADDGAEKHPEAAHVLKHNTYMDDICVSAPSTAETMELTNSIDDVLAECGFKVKEWLSNKPLNTENDEAKEEPRPLLESTNVEKVLGVVWDQESDMLSYKVNLTKYMFNSNAETDEPLKLTKRKILSQVARIFDPIGFASAFVIRAKIGLQKLWQQGLDWDMELPEKDKYSWSQLFREMESLNNVKFERCMTPPEAIGKPVLCIFSDASEDAFGACAYLRWQTPDDKFQVRFVTAKSRVAPLKQLTIPRLELQAAVLAARLSKTIIEDLTMQLEKVLFMTDSTITLSWIQSQARSFKPFVSARVGEIQSLTNSSQWNYVPGELNVADDVSRGIPVEKLVNRWKHGPEFLCLPEDEWPVSKSVADQAANDSEQRKGQHILLVTIDKVIDCERFSDWRRLVRVTAYVLRFVQTLKSRLKKSRKGDPVVKRGPLTPSELDGAEIFWIKEAQKALHERYERGEFKALSPFVENEIIRVGGRVKSDLISYEMTHPVMLPQKHHVSLLITRYHHKIGHNGVACTAAKVRKKYWILGVHRIAKSVKYRCVACRVMEHKVESQLMSNLPKERVAPFTPPFCYTSCDYFGPILVKFGRNKTIKHYGVIFTCLNTRAVHLELAVDCSTMEFIQVLRRFMAVRGQPVRILSDNGTQFVGAERELRQMVQGWNKQQLQEFCAERSTDWKFTTPAAPHQNGCAESLVKGCKIALKKATGKQVLTPMELHTCLQDVATLINQRPIGRIPNDPDDGGYLCPNDMLLGRASRSVPQGPFRETRNPRHRVEFVQKIVDSFWQRWTRDVLPLLVPRRKWDTNRRNVRVNDIVMLVESKAVRGNWLIGRVVEVYPGTDGKVRNVKVKTQSSEYRRPISKIVVIYPTEGYEGT